MYWVGGEAQGRQTGSTPWSGRFVIFLRVSLQSLLPGEGFLALIAREGGPSHCSLQSQVELDADTEKIGQEMATCREMR